MLVWNADSTGLTHWRTWHSRGSRHPGPGGTRTRGRRPTSGGGTARSWSPAVAALPPVPEPPERTLPIGVFWFAVAASIALVAGTRIVIQNTGNVLSTRLDREVLQWVFYVVLYGGLFLVVRSACRRFGSGSLRDDLGARFRWSDVGFGPVLFIGARVAEVVVTLPLLLARRRSATRRSATRTSSGCSRRRACSPWRWWGSWWRRWWRSCCSAG